MKETRNVRWSKSLHRKAARLLTSCKLIEILQEHGEVRPIGSYPANLMMNGDIDFHVISPNGYTMRKVLEVYNQVMLTSRFDYGMIWDWSKKFKRTRRTRGFPRGYYIGFKKRCGGVKWKIDIWLLGEEEDARNRKNLNVMNMTITAKQREVILAFKKIRNKADVFFSSQWIYDLVLVKGMTSRTKFKMLIAKEKSRQ